MYNIMVRKVSKKEIKKTGRELKPLKDTFYSSEQQRLQRNAYLRDWYKDNKKDQQKRKKEYRDKNKDKTEAYQR